MLKDLLALEKPSTKSFEELVECLQKHFTLSILKIAERFKLVKRVQADNEEIKKYAVALRKLATNCQYGAFLDDVLTQCFVFGLQNSGIQRKLLLESDLTFEKAVKLAEAMEKADSKVKKISMGSASEVNKLDETKSFKTLKRKQCCLCCGKKDHLAANCNFKNVECFRCRKVGDIARVCRKRVDEARFNQVVAHSSAYAMNEGNEDTVVINIVTVSETGVIWIKPVVNGEKAAMQLDTGSALTIMSKEDFQKLFVGEKLTKTTIVMKTFSGEKLKTLGYAIVKVCLNNQTLKLKLHVVDVKAPPWFGRYWFCSLYDQNDVLNVFNLNAEMHDNALSKLLNQYEAVFENALGK